MTGPETVTVQIPRRTGAFHLSRAPELPSVAWISRTVQ